MHPIILQSMRIHALVTEPAMRSLATLRFTVGAAPSPCRVKIHQVIQQSMRIHAMAKMPVMVSLATL
jgi:hypothetical protein